MNTSSSWRVAAAAAFVAVGAMGLASPAHAIAPTTAPAAASAVADSIGSAYLASFSDNANLPSRRWIQTTLCVANVGGQYGLLRMQPIRPSATPEFVEVQPGTTVCVERWWSGVQINAMNVSPSPLRVTTA